MSEYVTVVCKRNLGSSLLDGSAGLKSKQDVGSVWVLARQRALETEPWGTCTLVDLNFWGTWFPRLLASTDPNVHRATSIQALEGQMRRYPNGRSG